MLKHDDLDTIHSNLFELARMINYKSSDPYIKSMYQYIVNPIAWVVTEQAVRASKNIEDSKNSSQAVQQLKDSISELKAIRNGLKMFKRIPKNQFIRDIDAVLAKLESI